MKRILLFTLMITSSVSWAKWVNFGVTARAEFYYEDEPTQNNDGTVNLWTMNSGSPAFFQEELFLSSKDLFSYNCSDKTSKHLMSAAYSGEKGTGKLVYSFSFEEKTKWEHVIPGSISESSWKIACEKK
jgi:hypothetical protein